MSADNVRAGIEVTPPGRPAQPQRLRRSHATHLKAAGGDPTLALGHSSEDVMRHYYLDPVILGGDSSAARLPPIELPPFAPQA